MLHLEDIVADDGVYIRPEQTLGDIVRILSTERHDDYFPVLDTDRTLLGIVRLNDVRESLFAPERYDRPVTEFMNRKPHKILQHERIQSILQRFEEDGVSVLPVVDKENHYLGYISKNRILNAYREQLVLISQ